MTSTSFHIFTFCSTCQNYCPPWNQRDDQDSEAGLLYGEAETPLPCCRGKDSCEGRVTLLGPQARLQMQEIGRGSAKPQATATVRSGWTAHDENSL